MGISTEKRLLGIVRKLRDLAQDIENLARALADSKPEKVARSRAKDITIDDALVERLRGLGRNEAQQELASLSHKQLGSVVRALGGSSEEAKKTKDMIMERILYRLFDYSAGHKLLKGESQVAEKKRPTNA
ncbi:MAG: hypothetical protein IMF11_00280 [Proteobacteria bacterium]|nr:hypothetical protein [Pseudomonadota bacterium]